jgi:hypothetical protein
MASSSPTSIRGRLGERDEVAPDASVRGDVRHDRACPDDEEAVQLADPRVQLDDPLHVDDDRRPGGAVAEADDEVRPAREEAGGGMRLQQGERLREGRRPFVPEGVHG